MPFTTEYDSDRNIVFHRGSGNITAKEVMAQLHHLFKNYPGKHSIWDLRNAEVSKIPAAELLGTIPVVKENAKHREGGRTAWVTTRPSDFGLCRMAEMRSGPLPYERRVFKTMEEAIDWTQEAE
jgi:hypothetical protein